MAADIRNKQIQVQKPAQSLQHFQAKVASGDELDTGILRPVLAGLGLVVVVGLGWVGIDAWRVRQVERHEAAVAQLMVKVQGDGVTPVAAPEAEKLMREALPKLEALAKDAPASRRAVTAGLLASWKLQLDGKTTAIPVGKDPWSRLREAQRLLLKGDGVAAAAQLEPLRADATPQAPWGQLWWATRMDVHRLVGDRNQALKDLAEYKARYQQDADADGMARMAQGI